MTITTLNRWRLAATATELYPEFWDKYRKNHQLSERLAAVKPSDPDPPVIWRFYTRKNFVVMASSDWSPNYSWISVALFFIFTSTYGGIHAAAWDEYFPTPIERLLWWIACLFIMASSGMFYFYYHFRPYKHSPLADVLRNMFSFNEPRISGWSPVFWSWSMALLITMYIFCRIYLVVEAFISLRRLPVTAYQSPRLVPYFPHI